ncbi:hypothetical protein ACSU1N_00645 [Thermogladius sp. 4427co]|uniref:hypothetical protein n=1 Tax=Thermogladius sp. 4427co TaxID=3450718 RepID=UPI003F7AADB6
MCEKLRECGVPSISCEYGLENCISDIMGYQPDALVIVDAVYSSRLGEGETVFIDDIRVIEDLRFPTTHGVPFELVIQILRRNHYIKEAYLIGVSIKRIGISLEVSPTVLESGMKLADYICKRFREVNRGE